MSTVDDVTALALAAGGGDRAALSEFIRATQAEVWQFVARLAGRQAADDLAQETYLRVLGALAGFEGRSSARTWLLAIARRTVVDQLRREAARPRTIAVDWTRADEVIGERGAVLPDPLGEMRLEELLGTLSLERREALVLTRLLGFSYAEAADICGCAVGTIRSRVARARTDLVAALARQADGAAPAGR
ncbi:RNA polymerase subunit sigma [Actinomyces sp. oral taxon 414]|uniref:sigma-70 family RNA polymerase sigma factor n=1 Tax=Actinomyces sp. oral taxon 414 TaxID=712122 RepID=UPI0006AF086C|nr:sigma-70 family RNA polymerase sigma factor [Actinomyces sp. oral taxon 414]ALC98496.1 RNA polymerase subunit sigma [Actinomyces sp. oral taxon 414]